MKDGFRQLVSIQDAWRILETHFKLMPEEIINVDSALRRVVAKDIHSRVNIPHFERSAMDGYAVRAEDTFGCSQTNPARMQIIDQIQIYETSQKEVHSGTAIQVATGSPIPKGANAVIKIEEAEEENGQLEIHFPTVPGKHVMKLGEDVKKGDLLLKKGHALRPQDLTILISSGIIEIPVYKQPRVAIISTGSELIEPGKTPKIGQIIETNSCLIKSYTELYGGVPIKRGIIQDDKDILKNALHSALDADIVVFSGGTSVGERDYLPLILQEEGEILFHGVSMRPGSPIAVGKVQDNLIFCLPGFPVSTMIAFEVFTGPTIRKMQGASVTDPRPKVKARLRTAIPSKLGRRDFVRVRIDKSGNILEATSVRIKAAGIISSTTRADGVLEIPENVEGFEKDTEVEISLYLPLSVKF
ncbi:MAG: molybdopterin molybdotransferase MoeA [Candidatus Helarchaeota archaeon]